MDATGAVTLLEWKREIFELYAVVRAEPDPAVGWERWRAKRNELFATHTQSPLPPDQRSAFNGLDLFEYDPAYRVEPKLVGATSETYEIPTSGEEPMVFERVGTLSFALGGQECTLEAYWLGGYGGGLFVPFRDQTSGSTTYGAGRYLLDTIKGSDLGGTDDTIVLDFNFAYNPSCSYDPRWVCPLAPPPNRLDLAVEAGEKHRN